MDTQQVILTLQEDVITGLKNFSKENHKTTIDAALFIINAFMKDQRCVKLSKIEWPEGGPTQKFSLTLNQGYYQIILNKVSGLDEDVQFFCTGALSYFFLKHHSFLRSSNGKTSLEVAKVLNDREQEANRIRQKKIKIFRWDHNIVKLNLQNITIDARNKWPHILKYMKEEEKRSTEFLSYVLYYSNTVHTFRQVMVNSRDRLEYAKLKARELAIIHQKRIKKKEYVKTSKGKYMSMKGYYFCSSGLLIMDRRDVRKMIKSKKLIQLGWMEEKQHQQYLHEDGQIYWEDGHQYYTKEEVFKGIINNRLTRVSADNWEDQNGVEYDDSGFKKERLWRPPGVAMQPKPLLVTTEKPTLMASFSV